MSLGVGQGVGKCLAMFKFQLISRTIFLGLNPCCKNGKEFILKIFHINLLIEKVLPVLQSLLTVNRELIKN